MGQCKKVKNVRPCDAKPQKTHKILTFVRHVEPRSPFNPFKTWPKHELTSVQMTGQLEIIVSGLYSNKLRYCLTVIPDNFRTKNWKILDYSLTMCLPSTADVPTTLGVQYESADETV